MATSTLPELQEASTLQYEITNNHAFQDGTIFLDFSSELLLKNYIIH